MKDKFTIASNSNYGILLIVFFGGIVFFSVSFHFINDALSGEYTDLVELIGGSIFGLLGTLLILKIFFYEYFFLDGRKLTVRIFLGTTKKVIYLDEIIYYTETQKKGKGKVWHELTIYTSKTKQTLPSNLITNYEVFKQILIKDKPKETELEIELDSKTMIYSGGGTCIVAIILLLVLFDIFTDLNKKIKGGEITIFSDIITNKLELFKPSKGGPYISAINLKKFPSFAFRLDEHAFDAARIDDILTNFEIGDTIYLGIKTKEYKMKLTKEMPLGFWDKHSAYEFIEVYNISDNDYTYLKLESYNQAKLADDESGKGVIIFFLVFSFFIFCLGLFMLLKGL